MTDDRQPNCPRCNQLIPADAKTCPHCGYLIEIEPPVSRAEVTAEELNVASWLGRGWQLFLSNPAGFIGFGIVALVVTGAAMLASNQIPVIGWALPTAVSAPLFAGFLTAAFKVQRGKVVEFGDFLRGFDFFVQLVLGLVVWDLILQFVCVLPVAVAGQLLFPDALIDSIDSISEQAIGPDIGAFLLANPFETLGLALLFTVLLIPATYLAVGYTFMNTLIIDQRLGFWQAMESSRKVVHRQWWTFFRFGALLFLINIVGMLAFGVGALVSLPVTYCAVAVAYADVFGLRNE